MTTRLGLTSGLQTSGHRPVPTVDEGIILILARSLVE